MDPLGVHLVSEVQARDGVEVVGPSESLSFEPNGSLQPVDWQAWMH
jgi:hypothetical protein